MLADDIVKSWYAQKQWHAYPFQLELAQAYFENYNGLLNAPTGSGKTYAMWIPIVAQALTNPHHEKGLKVLWITPLRALAKDICVALQEACDLLGLQWRIEMRTGDISTARKTEQKKNMPDCLIITPESLHVLFCSKAYKELFRQVECIVVDEWHELLGSKRGVQTELAIAHIRHLTKKHMRIWGISATIGNLVEAMEVLLGDGFSEQNAVIIRSSYKKQIEVHTVLPHTIEVLPWAGHIGLQLLPQINNIIMQSKTTLVFTNTRAMAEIWYHHILHFNEELAGVLAMHHGSLSGEVRDWVEDNLHAGKLKAVICTSSLDLGVDFRPVDAVIQIGSPKGVARFTQRAGRSGHHPGAISRIYFVPTHALELVEISAIKEALQEGNVEKREPLILCFDVLIQFLVSLSIAEGFLPNEMYTQIKSTHAYRYMKEVEWQWILQFITHGGQALHAYDEFSKVGIIENVYRIINKNAATKHRLQIGTIVSDPMVRIAYLSGGSLGTVEEYFIASLKPGDIFWFAGLCLEFVMLKEMTAFVKQAKEQKAATASYMGGRMPLSSYMADLMRKQLEQVKFYKLQSPEYALLMPLLELQQKRSTIPTSKQLLVEITESAEGLHIFFYPFEGRVVHEVMSGLVAYRLSRIKPVSISIAMNDYGFELLCNEKIGLTPDLVTSLFTTANMENDLLNSVNATEMAGRKFRDIAIISGMIFTGYPGQLKRNRHLQASSQLLFDVMRQYEPTNLLFKQSYEEVLTMQMENARMRSALLRIQASEIVLHYTDKFSPFAFPIVVDSLRDKLSSEQLSSKVKRMLAEHVPAE
jgi:ATP-dependent Lhr-like helicase